jgi:hypothetical protein
MAADAALKTALERDEWDSKAFAEFDRLRKALDKAYADHRGVIAGDAEVVGRLFDEIEKEKDK